MNKYDSAQYKNLVLYQKRIQKIIDDYESEIEHGVTNERRRANVKYDEIATSVVGSSQFAAMLGYMQRNEKQLQEFLAQKYKKESFII